MKKILIHSFAHFDRSGRVRWLLEEMNIPYEDKFWDNKSRAHKTPEFLAINPMGAMPVAELDGQVVTESTGIVLALCDRFSEMGFAPALDSPDRALYFQWHSFAATTMEMAFAGYFATRGAPAEQRAAELEKVKKEKAPEIVAMLEKRLKDHEFIVGNSFTSADILVASSLPYGEKILLEQSPILQGYWKRMSERPAAKRAKLFG